MMIKKTLKYIFLFFILLLLLISEPSLYYTVTHADNANVFDNSSSEIVMEATTKRILYANNIYAKKPMASTTKILTAITIIENCDLNAIVTVTKQTVGIEGSSIYLEEGERLSVKDLLYGLMLRSGNDCAETLAVYCSGSIENFALLMNQTAIKIGAKNSNFVNPHGLHSDEHYTTAYDLALISCYAMNNETFKEIASTKRKIIPFTTKNTQRLLINKNKMLDGFDGANGVKTGFTKKAGRCLVSGAQRNGMQLVCVVLNCPPMFERSKELLQTAFNDYSMVKVVESDEIIDFIEKENGQKTGVHIKNDVVIPLKKSERDSIRIVYDLPEKLKNDLRRDTPIGKVKIYCENNLIFTEKVYTI